MTPLLESGLQLMLVGMATVFVFLTILVLATSLMSRLVNRFAPSVALEPGSGSESVMSPSLAGVDATRIAVMAAAITQHRQRQNQRNQH